MPNKYDELYINKGVRKKILLDYINDGAFPNILTDEKRRILSFLCSDLSYVIFSYADYVDAQTTILNSLLKPQEDNKPDLIPLQTADFLRDCVAMNEEEIQRALIAIKVNVPNTHQLTPRNEYVAFVSKATIRLIEEAARNLDVIPKNEKKRSQEEEVTTSTPRQKKQKTVLFAEQPTRASTRKKLTPTNPQTPAPQEGQQSHYPLLKN